MREPLTEPIVDGRVFLLAFLILVVIAVWWWLDRVPPAEQRQHEVYFDPHSGIHYCAVCGDWEQVGEDRLEQTSCSGRPNFF